MENFILCVVSRKQQSNGNQHHVHAGYVKLIFTDLVLFDIGSHTCFSFYHYLLVSNYYFHFCLKAQSQV